MYKIYAIDVYAGSGGDFKDNKKHKEYTLENLLKELENDKGYHMRICSTRSYIFFGDCDEFIGTFGKFAKLLIEFLLLHYKIEILPSEISYTENKFKDGSFHYSIPKIFGTCAKLKEIHKAFYEKHIDIFKYLNNSTNKMQKVIDTTIYSNKWFRYPEQSKEKQNGTKHIIKNGKMIDFIVEHIPKNSLCIDDKEYIKNDITNRDNVVCLSKKSSKKSIKKQKTNIL